MTELDDAIQVGITDSSIQFGNTGFLDCTECSRHYVNIPRALDHFAMFANWFKKIEHEANASRVQELMQN